MSKRIALGFLVTIVALLIVVRYSSLVISDAQESKNDYGTGTYGMGTVPASVEQKVEVEIGETNSQTDKKGSTTDNSEGELTDSERPAEKEIMEIPKESPNLPYPKKLGPGIVLTFDDFFVNQWHSFLNLSYVYGAKATFYVCYADRLTDDQIIKLAELQTANNEIGYHTLNHVNLVHLAQHRTVDNVVETEIIPGLQILREKGFKVNSFAYPYGAGNDLLDRELLKHFGNVRYTAYTEPKQRIKDVNEVYINNESDPRITYAIGIDKRYGHSLEEIFEGIDRAYNNNEVLLLYAHSISDKSDGYVTSMETLEEIVKYVIKKQMKFYTVSELAKP